MMHVRLSLSVVIVILLNLAPGVAGAGEREFAVHLNRPGTAGEEKLLTLSFARNLELMVTDMRRPFEGQQKQFVELRARTQILEVDNAGVITKVRMVVEKGSLLAKKDIPEELKRGQVLIVQMQKSRRITVTREGTPLSDEAAMLLVDALPYNNTLLSEKTDPSLFGSERKQKVGDSWPLEPTLLGELMPRRILLDPSLLRGEMTLVSAVKYRGVPSLKVQVKMQIPHYTPGDGAMGGVMPRGFKFTDGSLDATFLGFYPIDQGKMPIKYSETVRATVTGEPDNHKGQGTAATHNTRDVEFTELPRE
jgi:hypothetical protein